jgi:hypothetical protein
MRITTLFFALCLPAWAGDFQTWLGGYADVPIGQNWRGFAEVQNRLSQSSTSEQRLLVRAAMGLRIGQKHSVWAGYGWTPTFTPTFQDEHRLWQQWMTERVWDHWTLTARFRLEERFLAGASRLQWRWREMIRGSYHPQGVEHWGIVLWDEFLNGLNGNEVVRAGFDENRLFLGARFSLGDGLFLEPGYLNVQVKQANGGFDILHSLAAYLFWQIPQPAAI